MNRKFKAAFSLLAGVVVSLTADPTMVVFKGEYYLFVSKFRTDE